MKILSLEFSSTLRSVAVGNVAPNGETTLLSSVEDPDFRGVTGLALIDRALKRAELKPPEIELVALGLGPGSFTGIRSAIAIAQGWHLARGVRVLGVSSTLCLAEDARRRGLRGDVMVLVDAQRGEVYIHLWYLDADHARELEPLRISAPAIIPSNAVAVGPEAPRLAAAMAKAVDLSPSAATLVSLIHLGTDLPPERLEPIYLRETTFVKASPPRHLA